MSLNGKRFNYEAAGIIICGIFLLGSVYSLASKARNGGPSAFVIDIYKNQVSERKGFLNWMKTATDKQGIGTLYNVLAPEAYCPDLVKVGTTEDGGKWMCAPQKVPNDCVIFALGINGAITFEVSIQEYSKQRCRIISVDSGKQTHQVIKELKEIQGTVVQAMIGNRNTRSNRTMTDILKEYKVKDLEILKMDIEGAELDDTMQDFLNEYTPAQIMIEIHGTAKQTLELFRLFSSKGYLLLHYEINMRGPLLCEYAFIHEDSLQRYGAGLLARYL